jgi:hypothetical protein
MVVLCGLAGCVAARLRVCPLPRAPAGLPRGAAREEGQQGRRQARARGACARTQQRPLRPHARLTKPARPPKPNRCFDTLKHFAASLACPAAAGPALTATVPTNARATVRIPLPAATSPAAVTVREGGAVVWAAGAFVPGVPGVAGAAAGAEDLPAGAATIDVDVGSGTFAFTVGA